MSDYPKRISISPVHRQKRDDDFYLIDRKAFPGKGVEYVRADLAPDPLGAVNVKPLVWEYHPAGAIAAPPTGFAYIIDARMKGRAYSIKGFNPPREFSSMDEAKAAAQADYEARIMAALEPDTQDTRVAGLLQAASIAEAIMQKHAKAHYSGEVVKVFKNGDDTLSESAAKAYCAGEILEAIRAALAELKGQDDE